MIIRRHIEYNMTRLRFGSVLAMLLVFQGLYAQVTRDTIANGRRQIKTISHPSSYILTNRVLSPIPWCIYCMVREDPIPIGLMRWRI